VERVLHANEETAFKPRRRGSSRLSVPLYLRLIIFKMIPEPPHDNTLLNLKRYVRERLSMKTYRMRDHSRPAASPCSADPAIRFPLARHVVPTRNTYIDVRPWWSFAQGLVGRMNRVKTHLSGHRVRLWVYTVLRVPTAGTSAVLSYLNLL
jgi:hypothetical protein